MRRSVVERFNEKVERTDACWLWRGSKDTHGYGYAKFDGRRVFAHRLAVELEGRAIPPGMYVCHHCDTPLCVRPDHLFVGTAVDNMRDMVAKGRNRGGRKPVSRAPRAGYVPKKTHCRNGHELTEANAYVRPEGNRGCRECRKQHQRGWRARRAKTRAA